MSILLNYFDTSHAMRHRNADGPHFEAGASQTESPRRNPAASINPIGMAFANQAAPAHPEYSSIARQGARACETKGEKGSRFRNVLTILK